jgi:hypothetical protein
MATLLRQNQIFGLQDALETLQQNIENVDFSEYNTIEEINEKLADYLIEGEGITIETDEETGVKTISANRIELFNIVTTLPDEGETNKIYLKSENNATNNQFTEWIYVDDEWEVFGHIEIDLSGYSTTTQVQNLISTAKSEAITAAEADATSKANAAQTAAISTAEADATSKANTAQATAISTAATDATSKADAAQAAAISTAATDATNKANTAKSEAITTANTYTNSEIAKLTDEDTGILALANQYTDEHIPDVSSQINEALNNKLDKPNEEAEEDVIYGINKNGEYIKINPLVQHIMDLSDQCDGINVEFTLSETIENESIFLNGQRLFESIDYNINNTTLYLTRTSPEADESLCVIYFTGGYSRS